MGTSQPPHPALYSSDFYFITWAPGLTPDQGIKIPQAIWHGHKKYIYLLEELGTCTAPRKVCIVQQEELPLVRVVRY